MAGVRLDGDFRRLTRALRNLSEVEFKQANKTIGQALRESTMERFKTSKSPEGTSWQPKKVSDGKKILLKTARLRNSIKSKASDKGVAIGTNTIYAARHQFGDKKKVTIKAKTNKGLRFLTANGWRRKKVVKVKMPARPFLGINEEDIQEIKGILNDIIEEATQ